MLNVIACGFAKQKFIYILEKVAKLKYL